ncbi:MAG: hypothetical protein WBM87_01225, partial [Woeseiaceae bacterium]
EKGVPADRIEVITDEQEATARALEMARAGDLILVLGDNTTRAWKQIIYFNSGSRLDSPGKNTVSSVGLLEGLEFEIADDLEIISDERGVRIAREEGD